jgi:hypothetical protein
MFSTGKSNFSRFPEAKFHKFTSWALDDNDIHNVITGI